MEGSDWGVEQKSFGGALEDVELLGNDVPVLGEGPADELTGIWGVETDAFVVDTDEGELGVEEFELAKEVVCTRVDQPGEAIGEADQDKGCVEGAETVGDACDGHFFR